MIFEQEDRITGGNITGWKLTTSDPQVETGAGILIVIVISKLRKLQLKHFHNMIVSLNAYNHKNISEDCISMKQTKVNLFISKFNNYL